MKKDIKMITISTDKIITIRKDSENNMNQVGIIIVIKRIIKLMIQTSHINKTNLLTKIIKIKKIKKTIEMIPKLIGSLSFSNKIIEITQGILKKKT